MSLPPPQTQKPHQSVNMHVSTAPSSNEELSRRERRMAAYKASEKRWKPMSEEQIRADPQLLDVLNLTPEQKQRVRSIGTWQWTSDSAPQPILAFDGFGDQHEGFYVIPNAIDAKTQLQVAYSCLYARIYIVCIPARIAIRTVTDSFFNWL